MLLSAQKSTFVKKIQYVRAGFMSVCNLDSLRGPVIRRAPPSISCSGVVVLKCFTILSLNLHFIK